MGLAFVILPVLCLQNTAYTVLRRYSQGVLQDGVPSAVVLLTAEVLKFGISVAFLGSESGEKRDSRKRGLLATKSCLISAELRSGAPMFVPAFTYLVMNLISFQALALVDASTFSMIAQLKVLSTAICSSILLQRRFSTAQWRAMAILTFAVGCVSYQRGKRAPTDLVNRTQPQGQYLLGICLALLEVFLSGLVGVYFERYLKNGKSSVWGRNIQLSFWSIFLYGIVECGKYAMRVSDVHDAAEITYEYSVFSWIHHWSFVTTLLVLFGGAGGLLVAFAIKKADAVLKSMACTFSLILVCVIDIAFLGSPADPIVLCNSIISILAMQVYTEATSPPPAAKIAENESCVKPNFVNI